MTTSAASALSNSELDFLLSLKNSVLEKWLSTLDKRNQVAVIQRLMERAPQAGRPASPAELGARAWGGAWMMSRHLQWLDKALTDLAARKIRRLLVMMPPRHGKSVLISQFFPAWYLGTHPDHRVIFASYEAQFAASWGRKARDIMEQHGWECFRLCVRSDASAANRWDLENRFGGMSTAGVGGPITGRGADLLIVDDPVKNAEQAISETYRNKAWDWWTSTAFTRLEPDAVAVIVQTRWHQEDLAGRVQSEQAGEGWHVIRLPAIAEPFDVLGRSPGEALWSDRFPLARLAKIRDAIPTYWWDSLYQQQPSRHHRVLWPSDYFEGEDLWFDDWPCDLKLKVMTLDPSKGRGTKQSDYSAYVMLGIQAGGELWVEADMSISRPPWQLVDEGVDLVMAFQPDAFRIESNAWQDLLGPMFAEAFRSRGLLRTQPGEIHNRIKKEVRIESLDGLLKARQIHFRRTPGTETLVSQLRDFPVGKHDDGPDALEMAVRTAQELWEDDDGETVSLLTTIGI